MEIIKIGTIHGIILFEDKIQVEKYGEVIFESTFKEIRRIEYKKAKVGLLRGLFDLSFSVLTATMPKIDSPHRTDYVIITMNDYKVFRFETYLNRKEIKYLESIKS